MSSNLFRVLPLVNNYKKNAIYLVYRADSSKAKENKSERLEELRKKLRAKTPIGKLDEFATHPHQEEDPLQPWPNNTNPHTGEIGGPKGPEPTRYGDWERKGRVTDF